MHVQRLWPAVFSLSVCCRKTMSQARRGQILGDRGKTVFAVLASSSPEIAGVSPRASWPERSLPSCERRTKDAQVDRKAVGILPFVYATGGPNNVHHVVRPGKSQPWLRYAGQGELPSPLAPAGRSAGARPASFLGSDEYVARVRAGLPYACCCLLIPKPFCALSRRFDKFALQSQNSG